MTDTHAHAADHAHGPSSTRPFLIVFGALSVFTLISFVVNHYVREKSLSPDTGFVLILGVAVIKALLVAVIFMHLKWDWGRLYFVIIPAMVLAPMMIFALLPDLVMYWKHVIGWQTPLPR